MTSYQPGDIVFLLLPFGDAIGSKRRPALVLLDTGDDDIVVARITSQLPHSSYDVVLQNWQAAGLRVPSSVRVHKLATMEKRLVERFLGTLGQDDWTEVHRTVRQLWGLI